MAAPLLVKNFGKRDYLKLWHAMQDYTNGRTGITTAVNHPDALWLVEHPPVFTQGLAGKREHLLDPGDIPVIQVDRGGQVTYHGPGQQMVYLLLNLRRKGLSVRALVSAIENAVIDSLQQWHITAKAQAQAPGVYVNGAKICALGLRIRKGCCFHGLALNVNMDLEPFQRINPCGFQGLAITQTCDLGGPDQLAQVQPVLLKSLARHLGYTLAGDFTQRNNDG